MPHVVTKRVETAERGEKSAADRRARLCAGEQCRFAAGNMAKDGQGHGEETVLTHRTRAKACSPRSSLFWANPQGFAIG